MEDKSKSKRQTRIIAVLAALVLFFGGTFVGNLMTGPGAVYADSSGSKTGVFAFWNTKSDGSGTTYAEGDKAANDKDTDLYAQWLVADANGGTINKNNLASVDNKSKTVALNDDAVKAPAGKAFIGWSTALKNGFAATASVGSTNALASAMRNVNITSKAAAAAGDGTVGTYTAVYADVYPVGSIYMSVNNTNPSTLFGGTWVQIKDRFLLAAGDTYKAGSTGGEATHKLTKDEMPDYEIGKIPEVVSDNHANWNNGGIKGSYLGMASSDKPGVQSNGNAMTNGHQWSYSVNTNGGGKAHNNMPPYLTVYVWQRTA